MSDLDVTILQSLIDEQANYSFKTLSHQYILFAYTPTIIAWRICYQPIHTENGSL